MTWGTAFIPQVTHFRPKYVCTLRRHSVYCLVDKVLRCEKIMPDKKKMTIHHFFPPTCKKNKDIFIYKVDKKTNFRASFYFFLRCEPKRILYIFFPLWQGQKDPRWSSSTKKYTECRLCNIKKIHQTSHQQGRVRESGGICPFFMLISGCKWVNNDKI